MEFGEQPSYYQIIRLPTSPEGHPLLVKHFIKVAQRSEQQTALSALDAQPQTAVMSDMAL